MGANTKLLVVGRRHVQWASPTATWTVSPLSAGWGARTPLGLEEEEDSRDGGLVPPCVGELRLMGDRDGRRIEWEARRRQAAVQ